MQYRALDSCTNCRDLRRFGPAFEAQDLSGCGRSHFEIFAGTFRRKVTSEQGLRCSNWSDVKGSFWRPYFVSSESFPFRDASACLSEGTIR
jgi:hypothetical protein